MIAALKPFAPSQNDRCDPSRFVELLPSIRAQARFAFRNEPTNLRAELVAEAIALAYIMFNNLVCRGRTHLAYASPLARYAIRQVRVGRRAGSGVNINDVTSPYAQRIRGFTLESLNRFDWDVGEWREVLVEDKHAGPAETAAARFDTADWYRSLPTRSRRVAKALARGESTRHVAQRFGVSPGRISQLRRELEQSWAEFQGEPVAA